MPRLALTALPVDCTETSCGAVTAGGVASRSVSACAAAPVFPAESVALQMIVYAPGAKGPVSLGTAVNLPSTSSAAVAVPSMTGVCAPVASL